MENITLVHLLSNIIISSVSSGIVSTFIASCMTNKQRKKQNQYQDAKDSLPILLEILGDLAILEQAYIFHGRFCPLIEHRCPNLSNIDGDGLTISFAQRAHQFRMVGHRIILNCKKIIFLTPKKRLPKIVKVCADIRTYLCSKKSADSNMHLDIMINKLLTILRSEAFNDDLQINEFSKNLREFNNFLDNKIQEEFSYLVE